MYDCATRISAYSRGGYIKQITIGVGVVLVLMSASLLVRAQTKDLKESAPGKVEKTPRPRQVANYPTMMDMTFPEFGAAVTKTDIALLSIGAIEEHGPNLPVATDAIVRSGATRGLTTVLTQCRY
jgi:Creatinine amidohydrolase